MNKNTNNGIDRRKFNFNLLIVAMLIIVFSMQLYNQKLLLNIIGEINDIDKKIDQYFGPIDGELPVWEEAPEEIKKKPMYKFE
jgi:ABC-type phosphate/phosphonate transport system permease subunit